MASLYKGVLNMDEKDLQITTEKRTKDVNTQFRKEEI